MIRKTYCISCGVEVEVEDFLVGSQVLYCCKHCGLALDYLPPVGDAAAESSQGRGPAPAPAATAQTATARDTTTQPKPKGELSRRLEKVLIAEDSTLLRTMMQDTLVGWGLATTVESCEDGERFLERATVTIRDGQQIDLVVMDVEMPLLDGLSAAIAFRVIENALRVKKHAPILFFSARQCDQHFRTVMQRVSPARYLNKGVTSGPQELAKRVSDVLIRLLKG